MSSCRVRRLGTGGATGCVCGGSAAFSVGCESAVTLGGEVEVCAAGVCASCAGGVLGCLGESVWSVLGAAGDGSCLLVGLTGVEGFRLVFAEGVSADPAAFAGCEAGCSVCAGCENGELKRIA